MLNLSRGGRILPCPFPPKKKNETPSGMLNADANNLLNWKLAAKDDGHSQVPWAKSNFPIHWEMQSLPQLNLNKSTIQCEGGKIGTFDVEPLNIEFTYTLQKCSI